MSPFQHTIPSTNRKVLHEYSALHDAKFIAFGTAFSRCLAQIKTSPFQGHLYFNSLFKIRNKSLVTNNTLSNIQIEKLSVRVAE
jgi:hypothetical protein